MSEIRPRTRVLDTIIYYLISWAFFLLGMIPPKAAGMLADVLGRIWFVTDRQHREVAIGNLNRAFGDEMPPAQVRALARKVFCSLIRIAFEIGWALHIKKGDVRKYFRFHGMGSLQAALQKKKGVLILTAHLGNWELLVTVAAKLGLPISAIYRPMKFKPLDLFFRELRSRNGASLFPKKGAMRKVLRSLKNNELVGVLLDQHTGMFQGVAVDFFGEPAGTNKGLAFLARETGAPVVPMFLVRENGVFRVECGPQLPDIRTGDQEKDIEATTRLYNRVIESMIRRYPEQWFWVHRRWKIKEYEPLKSV
ncbi:MAG: lysophospholipid acyltransferase family protein [Desulfobacteraceae bacterium]|nr:lysophospholipid acyltransferase family protein [Desulfobacteraceae bacterium]